MLVKALILKKLVLLAVTMTASALIDAKLTNRTIRRGGRELNPVMKPFVGTRALYVADESDVALADIMLWKRPKSKITKALVIETIAGHAVGIASNLRK